MPPNVAIESSSMQLSTRVRISTFGAREVMKVMRGERGRLAMWERPRERRLRAPPALANTRFKIRAVTGQELRSRYVMLAALDVKHGAELTMR